MQVLWNLNLGQPLLTVSEKPMKLERLYELIVVIVSQGFSDQAMESAKVYLVSFYRVSQFFQSQRTYEGRYF